ncbi:MAG: orotidine-5'-phosphate decarboxylase [Magnetovibrio sp.]|nr:orotidine-5'-phosphate decarboxylase [Magnetovibrio sp.]|tara:strand:+ start:560 stop:1264 length:705 start_codon:yes stop_codon:yes gene_type:complete
MKPNERILVALDTTDKKRAKKLITGLNGHIGGVKIGKEFFTANGPQGVRYVLSEGQPFFLDLKFHDIPNTVIGALRSAMKLKPSIVNVHASGGAAMLRAAAQTVSELGLSRPLLIAVTILTSLEDTDMADIGFSSIITDQVLRLAKLAQKCGLDGVVCSPHEIKAIRDACGSDFKLIVPGIRPGWATHGDQRRITTPRQAIDRGADYIVIGRPITDHDKPVDAAKRIVEELSVV